MSSEVSSRHIPLVDQIAPISSEATKKKLNRLGLNKKVGELKFVKAIYF